MILFFINEKYLNKYIEKKVREWEKKIETERAEALRWKSRVDNLVTKLRETELIYAAAQNSFKEYLRTEEFIDSLVKRIKDKQL